MKQLFGALTLSKRLSISFGLVLLILLGLTALALVRMETVGRTLSEVTGAGAQRSLAIRKMERSAGQYGAVLRGITQAPPDKLVERVQQLSRLASDYAGFSARARSMIRDPAALALLKQSDAAALLAQEILARASKEAGDRGAGAVAFTVRMMMTNEQAQWEPLLANWGDRAEQLSTWDEGVTKEIAQAAAGVATSARWILVGGALVALVVAAVLGWHITRDVTRGIDEAVRAARRMAGHDLSQVLHVTRQDEIGVLMGALEDMRLRLNVLASGVTEATQSIRVASAEISQGSLDLSSRTEIAAATLQRVTSTVHTLFDSVQHTSSSAEEANALAASADRVANQGEQIVSEAVMSMAAVDDASRRIADIIALIDGIAFQTNILALNAAVEAARAGEHGRGFTVVAEEVRALAQRSANAAREVKGLIENSLEKVANGSQQINRAGDTTQEIRAAVERVVRIMMSILQKAAEQLGDIGDTRQAVVELESVAQHNASMAEQTAAAARSLNDQATRLSELVVRFKLARPSVA